MTESSLFPRGRTKEFHSSGKRKRDDSAKKEQDLFMADEGKNLRKYKRFRNTSGKKVNQKFETTVEFNQTSVELLDSESLTEEILLLGIVQQIKKYKLVISLPNCLTGYVPVTEISDLYTNQLMNYANNSGKLESPPSLREIFQIGSYVVCKVKEISLHNQKKLDIKLTLNPSELYKDMSPSCLQNNTLLMAAVESVEDHGYIMNVGVLGITAFLSKNMVSKNEKASGHSLHVGQLVLCAVVRPKKSSAKSTRALNLTAITKHISKAVFEKDAMPLTPLLPGTLVPFTISKVVRNGIFGQFRKRKILVNFMHFAEPFQRFSAYKEKQTTRGRVLYTHPVTKAVYVTLQTTHVHLNREVAFGGLRYGDFVDDAKVEMNYSSKAILSVNKYYKAVLKRVSSACENITQLKETYTPGSVHRCRVLKLLLMDNIILLSTKPEFLQKEILHLEDVKAGDIIKCQVIKQQRNGLAVTVGLNTRGFIPLMYVVDKPDAFSQKVYKPGKILKCRVLKCDFEKKLVILSSKPSMVSSSLPIVTGYADASPGMLVQGCVFKELGKGYLIAFYNDFMGYVSMQASGPGAFFKRQLKLKKGELVQCKVERCFPESGRILLSLEDNEQSEERDISSDLQEEFQIGSIVSCKVASKSEDGLDVTLFPSGMKAFLPVHHLSDYRANWSSFLKIFQIGDVIEEALCYSYTAVPIVTLRKSFIDWVKIRKMPSNVEDVKMGMMMPLIVRDLHKIGIFVEGIGNVDGLVHISTITGGYLMSTQDSRLNLRQTVIGKVIEIKDNNKIAFTMKLNDCQLPDVAFNEEFLKAIIFERDFIKQQLSEIGEGLLKLMCSLKCGSVIDFTVGPKVDDTYTGTWASHDVKGVVAQANVGRIQMNEGDVVSAVVLSVDFDNCCLHLAVDNEVVEDLPKAVEGNCKNFQGKIVAFRLLLVDEEFIFGIINNKGLKAVAFLPSKSHPNEGVNLNYLSSQSKEFFVSVKSTYRGYALATKVKPEEAVTTTVKKIPSSIPVDAMEKLKTESELIKMPEKLMKKKSVEMVTFITSDKVKNKILKMSKAKRASTFRRQKAAIIESKGLFLYVKLANGSCGRVHISELCDSVEEGSTPLKKYSSGEIVKVLPLSLCKKITNAPKSLKTSKGVFPDILECTMRESLLQDSEKKHTLKKYGVGDTVTCYFVERVKNCAHFSLNSTQTGKAILSNLSSNSESKVSFQFGQAVTLKVIDRRNDGLELSSTDVNDCNIQSTVVISTEVDVISDSNVKPPSTDVTAADIAEEVPVVEEMKNETLDDKSTNCSVKENVVISRISEEDKLSMDVEKEMTSKNDVNSNDNEMEISSN